MKPRISLIDGCWCCTSETNTMIFTGYGDSPFRAYKMYLLAKQSRQ